jgi:uncharacterized protein with LGFP repeats
MAFIHHTDNLNTYSKTQSDDLVRAIYWYHTQALGWCDIAYNFLVDKYGQVFEGRAGGVAQAVIGAATRGFNTGSVSVSAIGNYETARPSSVMIGAIERLLAWRLDVAHVDPTGTVRMLSRGGSTGDKYPNGTWHRFKTISGHRDAGFTACPGTYLYAELGAIRTAVYHRGLPKIFDPRATTTDFVTTQGSVTWTARGSTSLKWELQVLDANGAVARTWTASGWTFSRSWDGRASDGTPVPPGAYTIVLRGTRASQRARAASFTLMIEPIPTPSPSPSPSESPGPTPSPTDSPSPSPSDSPSPSPSPTESLAPSPSPS